MHKLNATSWIFPTARPLRLAAAVRLLAGLAFLGLGLPAHATSERISDIRVTGAERIPADTILKQIALTRGELYTAAQADASLHTLFATQQYKDVKIDHAQSTVTISVVENPIVADVTYIGNTEIKSEKFKDIVKLKKGAIYSDAKAHADTLALREIYRNEGRLPTVIEQKLTPKGGNKVDVAFNITESKVDKVSSITFEGNAAFSAYELEGVVRTIRSSWLDIIKSGSTFVAAHLDDDRELLRRHYLSHGYADVKIVSAEGTLDATGNGYAVKFVIEEGDPFNFANVSVETRVTDVDVAKLTSLLQIRSGDVYNAMLIDKSTEAVALALWDSGQHFARVVPKIQRDPQKRQILVAFRIEDGAHTTIERVEVSGNSKTRTEVILREMKLREGEAFNPLILERDKSRIKALGFFKNVETTAKPDSAADKVIVTVTVDEDQTMVLSVGGGYSTTDGILGDIAVEDHNLFGTGRWAKLKLSGSMNKLQAEASFTEPHLLGTNVVGGFDIFYKDYDASRLSSYKSQKIGGDLRAAYALTDTVTGSVNYTFTQNKIYDVGANASTAIKDAIPGYPTATSNTYYTSSVGYSLAYDTRNAKKLPTSGHSFVLAQDLAGVGGDVRYIKSSVDARTYFPLASDVTLVGRATAGTIMGWGGQDVRLLDMYYMGGETVRGFAASGIGPRDTASANADALGGKSYISTTAEMRFGLPLVPEGIGIRGAVFADAGSLFGTANSAGRLPGLAGSNPSLRASVGAGLIWDSPIGALRADYAFPLAKQTFDKTQPWSFGLAAF